WACGRAKKSRRALQPRSRTKSWGKHLARNTKLSGQILFLQSFADGGEHQMMHGLTVAKTHLNLRRMDVHIHMIGRQFQEQERDGVSAGHEQAAIGFLQGVAETAVANPSAIDEQILHLGVAALVRRIGNVAAQQNGALPRLQGIKALPHIGAEKYPETIEDSARPGYLINVFAVVAE